jgi:hypothetical protein
MLFSALHAVASESAELLNKVLPADRAKELEAANWTH